MMEDLEHTEVPQLPDDIMLMIFGELKMNEKFQLGTTCKRFRELDFEIGRKYFDYVSISWTDSKQCVDAFHESKKIVYCIDNTKLIQYDFHSRRLFRYACAQRVFVDYAKSEFDENDFSTIESMLKKLKYYSLEVMFRSKQDCSKNFVHTFILNRNLKSARVKMSWLGRFNHDLEKSRKLLMQLPRMDKLGLSWQNVPRESRKYLVNDTTLLHICSMVNDADLSWTDCTVTVQGILNAFQIVAQSAKYKYVGFYVTESVADELLRVPEHNFTWKPSRGSHHFVDNGRQTILSVYRNSAMKHGIIQMEKCVGRNARNYKVWE